MASIPITIQGVMFYTGLDVGGGPTPGGPPPQIWPSPGVPTHPIYNPPGIWGPGQMPPGFWGGGMGPGVKPQPPGSGGGQPPLGIWGGAPPYVDIGGPGPQPRPEHPIVIPPGSLAPGIPSHPIYWPIYPDQGLPGPQPHPEHPIVIPGDDATNPKFEVKAAWSPQTGWITVIVPAEGATVPTPST